MSTSFDPSTIHLPESTTSNLLLKRKIFQLDLSWKKLFLGIFLITFANKGAKIGKFKRFLSGSHFLIAKGGAGVTIFRGAQFIFLKFVNFLHRLLFDMFDLTVSIVIESHIQIGPRVVGELAGSVLIVGEAVVRGLFLQFVILFVCGDDVATFMDYPH